MLITNVCEFTNTSLHPILVGRESSPLGERVGVRGNNQIRRFASIRRLVLYFIIAQNLAVLKEIDGLSVMNFDFLDKIIFLKLFQNQTNHNLNVH